MRTAVFILMVLVSRILPAGGCPGCGGYSGSAGGGSNLLGLVGSQFGNYGNNFTLALSTAEFGGHDMDSALASRQISLSHWISLQYAAAYNHTFGEKAMFLGQKFDYDVKGVGDMGLMAWFDLPGRTRFQPCPLDGDVTAIPDYWHVMIGVGTTAPTGKYDYKDDWGYYPAEFQLGTGTWNPLVSAAVFKRFNRFQPQLAVLYKFDERKNDIGYWRSDAVLAKADFIYLTQPKKKGAVAVGVSWSNVLENDRDYNWGVPGTYREIDGTGGKTLTGYIAYGFEVFKGFRPALAYSFPVSQPSGDGTEDFRRAVSVMVNYNF